MGKEHFLKSVCTLVVASLALSTYAQQTNETLALTTPGTLKELVSDLETTSIDTLRVKGGLNAADLTTLREAVGVLRTVAVLDLREVQLIAGDEPYNVIQKSSSVMGDVYVYQYFISDSCYYEFKEEWNPLGGSTAMSHCYYGNDMAAAFADCPAYSHVLLPAALPRIGMKMFSRCTKTTLVQAPEGITSVEDEAFYYSSVVNVNLPSSVTRIGNHAFVQSKIESVGPACAPQSVGERAFYYCTSFQGINLQHLTDLGMYAFYHTLLQGELDLSSLDTIPMYAFGYLKNGEIPAIKFSPNLKVIEQSAFASSSNITASIILPMGLESIGESAFSGCSQISAVDLPSSLKMLGERAFSGTAWHNSLKGENGIVYAGTIALAYDNNTGNNQDVLVFKEGTTMIAGGFLSNNRNGKSAVTFPSTLKYIGDKAFYSCENLQIGNLPESLTYIGNSAFSCCYKLNIDKLPDSLTYIGDNAFAQNKDMAEYMGPSNLTFSSLPESVKHIGESAFANCTSFMEMTLHEGLETMGKDCFHGCSNIWLVKLNSRNLQSAERAFDSEALTRIVVGPEVKRIPDNMFEDTKNLEKLTFTDCENSQLTYIGNEAFGYQSFKCEALPPRLEHIGDEVFNNNQEVAFQSVPQTLRYIGDRAFNSPNIKGHVELPVVEYLGYGAFAKSAVQSVSITSSNPYNIGQGAFEDCDSLRTVYIANDIQQPYIAGDRYTTYMFQNCDSLSKVVFGSNVSKLPCYFMCNCPNVTELIFEDIENSKIDRLPKNFIQSCPSLNIDKFPPAIRVVETSAFSGSRGPAVLDLSLVDSLGEHAFYGCTGIQTLILPSHDLHLEGSNTYENEGFYKCEDIKEIWINGNFIGNSMDLFAYCRSLTTVHISKNVEQLLTSMTDLFSGCSNLSEIYCHATIPPVAGKYLGGLNKNLTIYVPAESVDAYMATEPWSRYTIKALPDDTDGIGGVDNGETAIVAIHDMNGTEYAKDADALPAGVYIITYSNGENKKVMIRK